MTHADRLPEYWAERCKRAGDRHACGRSHSTGQHVPMLRSLVMEHYLWSAVTI